NDTSYKVSKSINPAIAPRFSVNYKVNKNIFLYSNISSGFSPPSLSEVRTNEGSINLNLQPEDGLCFDIGARGSFFSKKLFIMGSFFVYRLKDAITTFTNVQGVVLFRNSGNITQRGFESEFAYDIIRSHSGAIRNLSL